MLPPKRTNEQRAMELLALFVEEIQKNNEFDEKLLHAVKEFLKNNGVDFHDDEDDDKDTEDFEERYDGEWDHIDGYSPKYIIMNSDPSIEWTASDFD